MVFLPTPLTSTRERSFLLRAMAEASSIIDVSNIKACLVTIPEGIAVGFLRAMSRHRPDVPCCGICSRSVIVDLKFSTFARFSSSTCLAEHPGKILGMCGIALLDE